MRRRVVARGMRRWKVVPPHPFAGAPGDSDGRGLEFPEKNMLYAKGIAHVSFAGGGLFLPARSAGDRQHLIERVTHTAATHGRVQILVDDQRWLVQPGRSRGGPSCTGCGAIAKPPCHAADAGGAYCVPCALGGREPLLLEHEVTRDAERLGGLVPRPAVGVA